MTAITSEAHVVETSGFPGASFGTSADGLPVALVGDTAFAMVPGRDGRQFLATGWRIGRPIEQWCRDDFYGHSGELADESEFRARVAENAEHQREKRSFGRREIRSSANTPWGPSQGATVYAEGVTAHSTAGHGGFHLSAERNHKVHAMLRARDGFYEEDECWAIVAFTFPQLFTGFERRCAERTMKDSYPDAWETITGLVLQQSESRKKDERVFFAKHADDWIVVSAIHSDHESGFTEVIAAKGGQRTEHTPVRRYLIPRDEYGISGGPFGFVIDPERHAVYDGPSSLVTWAARGPA